MPGFRVDTRFQRKGTLFEKPAPIINAMTEEMAEEVARVGKNKVLMRLGRVLRNPTGRYESRIQTERARTGWEVNDTRKVLYGPWLEGTSSRNRTTRFKGYSTFRLTRQELDAETLSIISPMIAKLTGRLK